MSSGFKHNLPLIREDLTAISVKIEHDYEYDKLMAFLELKSRLWGGGQEPTRWNLLSRRNVEFPVYIDMSLERSYYFYWGEKPRYTSVKLDEAIAIIDRYSK